MKRFSRSLLFANLLFCSVLFFAAAAMANGSEVCFAKLVHIVELSKSVAGRNERSVKAALDDIAVFRQGIIGTAVHENQIKERHLQEDLKRSMVDIDETCLK